MQAILLGRAIGDPSRTDGCNSRCRSGVLLQPKLKSGQSAVRKECLVKVSRKTGNIQTYGVLQNDSWILSAWLTKSDQLHFFSPPLRASTRLKWLPKSSP